MTELKDSFTSTGVKFFLHQEAMAALRDGRGMPVTSHIMLTDRCQHSCAFCSVSTREGNSLTMTQIREYLDQLVPLGLKSVILSGGGNPILYRCKETKADFNDAVDLIKSYGLEIGCISNGMPMKVYDYKHEFTDDPSAISGRICNRCKTQMNDHSQNCYDWVKDGRKSWKTVRPDTLDKLTWLRISMSGLDHDEREVFVPDIDPMKTTLGYSYVYHDIYKEPLEPNHGKVSTRADIIEPLQYGDGRTQLGKDRLPWLKEKIRQYVETTHPVYVRLLPNCLEPDRIKGRCEELQQIADEIDPAIVFVQNKPPKAPKRCFLGYIHPVLNSCGSVFPCDSVCLANAALKGEHKFGSPWAVCKWNEIADYFSRPVKSMVDSESLCSGCVFHGSNDILAAVVDGGDSPMPSEPFQHPNFV